MIRRPTRSTRTYTPFPYTTLFRSRRSTAALSGPEYRLGLRAAVEGAAGASPEHAIRLRLRHRRKVQLAKEGVREGILDSARFGGRVAIDAGHDVSGGDVPNQIAHLGDLAALRLDDLVGELAHARLRSEEHTSELQSLMRRSYAV